ncbi:MAG: tripartite tricarboxylate transporter substrate binding protein [Pusillimonas sp.]
MLLVSGSQAFSQSYPVKQLTFVVPFTAGSATDQQARVVAQGLTEATGIPVVVNNKVGASGFIAAQTVATAVPDGYTILVSTNTTHAANEHLFKTLPYDPLKDFEPVTALNKGSQILIVNKDLPVKNVKELIALAEKSPGKYTFGSGSSSSRMAVELFQQMVGIELLHVPYKSSPLAITDLIGGNIDLMIVDAPNALAQINADKVRGLAVSGAARNPLAPDLPTIAEAGVAGYDMSYWTAAWLPAKTPKAIVDILNELMVAATNSKPAQEFYTRTGSERYVTTPEELAQFQASETDKWGSIIRKAKIEKQ